MMTKTRGVALAAALVACGSLARVRAQSQPFDLLITNARIIDGTGGPSVNGSVAVRAGRIVGVGRVTGPAARTIDAGGLVLAPGFIDPHSHSDFPLLADGNAESKIRQGVTTEVIGESGSVAPREASTGEAPTRAAPASAPTGPTSPATSPRSGGEARR